MRERYQGRRLHPQGFRPRQHRLGSEPSPAQWLRQLYTPRWRQHLAVLLVALAVLPFTGPAARPFDLAATGHSALARLQGEPARPALRYHTVAEGESLASVAAQYGLSVETVRWANGLGDLDPLVVGQELLILPTDGVLHYLAPGESVRQVALYYGADPAAVAAYNGVADPDQPLRSAQLLVPGGRPRLGPAVASIGLVGVPGTPDAESADLPEGAVLLPFGDRTLVVVEDAERRQEAARAAAQPAKTWEEIQREAERATAAAIAASRRKPPAPIDYEVQPGDTVIGLAERYGVTPMTIVAANNLLNSDALSIGQKLVIPPVTGVLYTVQENDTLSEIALRFQVDLGPIVDYNGLEDADTLAVGQRLVIPGAEPERPKPPPPAPAGGAVAAAAQSGYRLASTTPSGPANPPARRSEVPVVAGSGKGAEIVKIAMQHLGKPYVWGGTGPNAFDCSGFVYFVHRQAGIPLSRGMMGQYTAGPRIPQDQLQPGDIVFFSNTYMPGLSHNGIYIGGGKFIHASDPSTGVVITSLSSAYWASRYSGATRVR